MKQRIERLTKLVILDTIGGLIVIAALLTGWLPGPGGIPLFLIGLSIISINHESAHRLKVWVREHSSQVLNFLFPHIPWVEWLFDGILIALLCIASAILKLSHHPYRFTVITFLCSLSLMIAIGNRSRWYRFKDWLLAKTSHS